MAESVEIRKVGIDPVDCYRQAVELVRAEYGLLLGVSALGVLIGGAVPVLLIGPMMCGLYMCFLDKYRGNQLQLDLLFKGFDYFVPSLIASLIITGVSLLIFLPVCFVMLAGVFASITSIQAEGGPSAIPAALSLGTMFFSVLCLFGLLMVVSLFFVFTFPLIVDRKLTGTAAIALSARAAAKNFGGVLGLTLIGVALGIVGLLACYVGTFFILPISLAAMTVAYRKVFPEIVGEAPSAAEQAGTA